MKTIETPPTPRLVRPRSPWQGTLTYRDHPHQTHLSPDKPPFPAQPSVDRSQPWHMGAVKEASSVQAWPYGRDTGPAVGLTGGTVPAPPVPGQRQAGRSPEAGRL